MFSRLKKMFIALSIAFSVSIVATPAKAAIDLSSYGITPTVTLSNNALLLSFVFQNIALDGGLRYSIPKYANSYIEISPDLESDGTLMALNIDLADLNGTAISSLNPTTLPGGRALPGITSGKLPVVAFTINKFKNVSVYASTSVFGIFIPVNINLSNVIVTARFSFASGTKTGNLSLVGKDTNGENSGILLLWTLKTLNS